MANSSSRVTYFFTFPDNFQSLVVIRVISSHNFLLLSTFFVYIYARQLCYHLSSLEASAQRILAGKRLKTKGGPYHRATANFSAQDFVAEFITNRRV